MTFVAVMLAGGSGRRLWPISRRSHPKPFIRLPDGDTLMGKTYARISRVPSISATLTVTNRELLFLSRDTYALSGAAECEHTFLLEPEGRDTTAAIALACLQVARVHGNDAIMLVVPVDQLLEDEGVFLTALNEAERRARGGQIVAFGVVPTRPETGFGYVQVDDDQVCRFVEKPDIAAATRYWKAGNYFWNSGMFCFSAGTMLRALAEHCPDILDQSEIALSAASLGRQGEDRTIDVPVSAFANVREVSIDYAVMEKASNLSCVPIACGWDDVGSWTSVADMLPGDCNGNRAAGEIVIENSRNCFVMSEDRLVGLTGVEDLLVVDTPDALLVAHRDQAQNVKQLHTRLKDRDHESVDLHRTAQRPWGSFTVLEEGEGFKIKRIEVKPGAKLSLQAHAHRAEHWLVVRGLAKVVNAGKELLMRANESTDIKKGSKHRLENVGSSTLVMIEIQSGDYLGEDDIIRFEDCYGRA